MKLEKNISINDKIVKTLEIEHSIFRVEYCYNIDSMNIEQYFSDEDNKKSFPPDGKLNVCELDHFFYIKFNDEIVGFYRIVDLFFDDIIELHTSFNKHDIFLIKAYIELSNIFLAKVMETLPDKKITSIVDVNNKKAQKFLRNLNFVKNGYEKSNKNFLFFEKIANMKVKIIKSDNAHSSKDFNKYIYLTDGETKFDYDDKFFLENHSFTDKKRIIKITNYFEVDGKKNKKSIYRKAISGNRKLGSTKANEIGLLQRDIATLKIKQTNNVNIKLAHKKFYFFPFYLFNPSYAVRISLISLLLGILSVILAIIGFF